MEDKRSEDNLNNTDHLISGISNTHHPFIAENYTDEEGRDEMEWIKVNSNGTDTEVNKKQCYFSDACSQQDEISEDMSPTCIEILQHRITQTSYEVISEIKSIPDKICCYVLFSVLYAIGVMD